MDISAIIIFHGERLLVPAAIRSFLQCCDRAAARGLRVERIAVIDRPDAVTQAAVDEFAPQLTRILAVDFGDLGRSRNAGREAAAGRYVTFFDGDDLWGEEWICRAYEAAERGNGDVVFHPRLIYYFSADDYATQFAIRHRPREAKSFYFVQQDSAEACFDPRTLIFNNIWTANSFAGRSLYERFPYYPVDRAHGFGVEDWTWNAETLAAGVRHAVVPDTIHCIRVKASASLGQQNVASGLLPSVYRFAPQLEALWEQRRRGLAEQTP